MRRYLVALLVAIPAIAVADTNLPQSPLAYTQLRDPQQEAAAHALMAELRCLVCQGQSIADSDADMAGGMRALVRERIAKGESAAAVRKWLMERYGDYVTYDPPISPVTAPLWLAPIALLLIGAFVARASFKRKRR